MRLSSSIAVTLVAASLLAACGETQSSPLHVDGPTEELALNYMLSGGAQEWGGAPRFVLSPDGRVAVLDWMSTKVRVYGSGGLLWQAGTKGKGPGENEEVTGASFLDDGRLAVWDGWLRRIDLYSVSGEQLSSTPVPARGLSQVLVAHADRLELHHVMLEGDVEVAGTFRDPQFSRRRVRLGIVGDSLTTPDDSLEETLEGSCAMTCSFSLGPDGAIVTQAYRLQDRQRYYEDIFAFDEAGEPLWSVDISEIGSFARPIEMAERIMRLHRSRQTIRRSEPRPFEEPEVMSNVAQADGIGGAGIHWISDHELEVMLTSGAEEMRYWIATIADGELRDLKQLELPAAQYDRFDLKDDYVMVVEHDAVDVPTVHVYRRTR